MGIDAEPHDVLPKGVLDAISLPIERAPARRAVRCRATALGSNPVLRQEATYKAWFPLTHRWLGFEDAHITFTLDGSGSAGTFRSRILIDPAAEHGPPLTTLDGRWSVAGGWR